MNRRASNSAGLDGGDCRRAVAMAFAEVAPDSEVEQACVEDQENEATENTVVVDLEGATGKLLIPRNTLDLPC